MADSGRLPPSNDCAACVGGWGHRKTPECDQTMTEIRAEAARGIQQRKAEGRVPSGAQCADWCGVEVGATNSVTTPYCTPECRQAAEVRTPTPLDVLREHVTSRHGMHNDKARSLDWPALIQEHGEQHEVGHSHLHEGLPDFFSDYRSKIFDDDNRGDADDNALPICPTCEGSGNAPESGRVPTSCEWCGRAIVPDHDGRWLRAKPPFEVECDASEDGWHSPASGRTTTPTEERSDERAATGLRGLDGHDRGRRGEG